MHWATKNLSISLPDELISIVEGIRVREHRSRSEVLREALRLYFQQRGLMEDPLPGELDAIAEVEAEGEYLPAEEVWRDLGITDK